MPRVEKRKELHSKIEELLSKAEKLRRTPLIGRFHSKRYLNDVKELLLENTDDLHPAKALIYIRRIADLDPDSVVDLLPVLEQAMEKMPGFIWFNSENYPNLSNSAKKVFSVLLKKYPESGKSVLGKIRDPFVLLDIISLVHDEHPWLYKEFFEKLKKIPDKQPEFFFSRVSNVLHREEPWNLVKEVLLEKFERDGHLKYKEPYSGNIIDPVDHVKDSGRFPELLKGIIDRAHKLKERGMLTYRHFLTLSKLIKLYSREKHTKLSDNDVKKIVDITLHMMDRYSEEDPEGFYLDKVVPAPSIMLYSIISELEREIFSNKELSKRVLERWVYHWERSFNYRKKSPSGKYETNYLDGIITTIIGSVAEHNPELAPKALEIAQKVLERLEFLFRTNIWKSLGKMAKSNPHLAKEVAKLFIEGVKKKEHRTPYFWEGFRIALDHPQTIGPMADVIEEVVRRSGGLEIPYIERDFVLNHPGLREELRRRGIIRG